MNNLSTVPEITDHEKRCRECRRCRCSKPIQEYAFKGKYTTGKARIDSICKVCKRQARRALYQKQIREKKSRRLSKAMDISKCIFVDVPVYEFDHDSLHYVLRDFALTALIDIE